MKKKRRTENNRTSIFFKLIYRIENINKYNNMKKF